jgi:hypothetical protein
MNFTFSSQSRIFWKHGLACDSLPLTSPILCLGYAIWSLHFPWFSESLIMNPPAVGLAVLHLNVQIFSINMLL